ncbi:MAG: ABC transporter permease [Gemmatimonadota bacterium]|nr:ABC transporter permease [Gemmatimonadota bacterium]MDH4351383.1 ABC transporter permease [Gemmatimonadota bacterium]MDH5198053.1 ABC transporter permease [Gemmatimonadota bacterium]
MPASLVIAGRILTELGRSRRVLALWIVFPATMLLLFGWVRADQAGLGPALTATAPGILIGAGFFFSCLGGPISVLVAERERRTLRRLLVSPLDGASYFLGVVLAHLAIAAAQVALVYGITVGGGGGFHGSLLLGTLIVLLSVSAYVGLGFLFAGKVAKSAEDVNGTVAGLGVPLLVLGGTFFPTEHFPPLLRTVAQANPVFHMNQAFRTVAAGGADPADVTGNLILLALLASVAMILGARSYRHMLDVERAL